MAVSDEIIRSNDSAPEYTGVANTDTKDLEGSGAKDLVNLVPAGTDPIFEEKASLINHAFQQIGMGKYQWKLFIIAGFGWMIDQAFETCTSLALPLIGTEFSPAHQAFSQLALVAGLVVGATFWGFSCDIIGRRPAFNLTLLIASIFGIAAGAGPTFLGTATLIAFVGLGAGGNLAIDGALFLEFLPGSHQFMLELLSAWWALGQIIPNLFAWWLLPNYQCKPGLPMSECMAGWRYLFFTIGGFSLVLWFIRYFCFTMYESPKYLIAVGRNADAVATLNAVAKYNGTVQPLTVEQLDAIDRHFGVAVVDQSTPRARAKLALKNMLPGGFRNLKGLFNTRKMARNMIILMLIWGMIGLASPLYHTFLPEYLSLHGAQAGDSSVATTYRNTLIIAVCSIPGTLIGGYLITIPRFGRRGTLSVSLILSGVFLYAFTTARTQATILAFNCIISVATYSMFGALYCLSPEVIESSLRGTGSAVLSVFNRICGLQSPIIAAYIGFSNAPLFISAGLFLVAGVLTLLLPYESRGKASI